MLKKVRLEQLRQEWDNCSLIKVFEFEVIDKRKGKKDWVVFDIELIDGVFRAQHAALFEHEEKSEYIAKVEFDIDPDFSLDENLQALWEVCNDKLSGSDFYQVAANA